MVGRIGRVEAISVRPARRAPTVSVPDWTLGSDADHVRSASRAVTLQQAEYLPVIEALLGRPAPFGIMRRNLLISGFNLNLVQGRRFRIGEVELEGTKPCDPCDRMEELLGPGGFLAMTGHGGWCARVHRTGTLRVGDEVELIDPAPTP